MKYIIKRPTASTVYYHTVTLNIFKKIITIVKASASISVVSCDVIVYAKLLRVYRVFVLLLKNAVGGGFYGFQFDLPTPV